MQITLEFAFKWIKDFISVLALFIVISQSIQAQSSLDSARHYFKLRQFEKAGNFANVVIANSIDSNTLAEAFLIQGEGMIRSGKTFRALTILLESKRMVPNQLSNDSLSIMINFYLGYVYTKMYDARGIECIRHSYNNLSNAVNLDSNIILSISHELGKSLMLQGYYKEGLLYAQEAKIIALALNDSARLSSVHNNLGIITNNLHQFENAVEHYNKSILYVNKNSSNFDYKEMTYLLNVSTIYITNGNIEEAENFLKRGIEVGRKGGNKPSSVLTKIYSNLSDVNERKGKYKEALELLKVALEFGVKSLGKNHPVTNNQIAKLANVYFKLGRYEESLENFKIVIKNFSASFGENHPFVGALIVSMAKVERALGNGEQAMSLLDQAKPKLYDIKDPQLLVDYWNTKIELEIDSKNLGVAIASIDSTYNLLNYKKGNDFNKVNLTIPLLGILKMEAKIKSELDDDANKYEAISLYKEFYALTDYIITNQVETQSKYFLLQNHYDAFENAINTSYNLVGRDSQMLEQAFFFMEKSKANLLTSALNDYNSESNTLLSKEFGATEQLFVKDIGFLESAIYELYQRNNPDQLRNISELKDSLFSNKKRYYSFLFDLKKEFPEYYKLKFGGEVNSLNQVQDRLNDDTAILEYFYGQNKSFVFAIQKDKISLIPLVSDSIMSYVDHLRDILNRAEGTSLSISNWLEYSAKISNKILHPVLKNLHSTIKRLIIVPDGPIAGLPFSALLGLDEKYLIHDYSISYHYSCSLWLDSKRNASAKGGRLLAFAPSYNSLSNRNDLKEIEFLDRSGELNLPGALDEVNAINKVIGGELIIGDAATKDAFLGYTNEKGIIHLAMHAISDQEHPQFSKLVFSTSEGQTSSSYLHASEIFGLKLKAQMAVLSACNTGYGKYQQGEAPLSLGYSFAFAGIPSTTMSLWKVPDLSTSQIMLEYYKSLKAGLRKDESMQKSVIWFLNNSTEEELLHPLYWAGFLVYGDINPIQITRFSHSAILAVMILISIILLRFILTKYFRSRRVAQSKILD